MKNMCHQLVIKPGDISRLITLWKGPTTEENAISFTSAASLMRKGVGHGLLGAEVMSEMAKQGVAECHPSGGSKVDAPQSATGWARNSRVI